MNLWIENELKLVKLDDLVNEIWDKLKNTNIEIVTCDDVINATEDFFTKMSLCCRYNIFL